MQAELTLGFGALIDRDPSLSGTNTSNAHEVASLQFGVTSKTRTQDLSLRVSSEKISSFGARGDLEVAYERRTKSSSFSANLSSHMLPVGDVFVGDFTSGDAGLDLVAGRTDLRIYNGQFLIKSGIGRPVSTVLSYGINHRDLQNGASSTTRHKASAELRARINSRTTGRVLSVYERLNTDAVLSQSQSAVAFGLNQKPTKLLEFDVQIGWRRIKADNRVQTGAEWQTSIARSLARGRVYGQASVERVEEGSVSSLAMGLTSSRRRGGSKLEVGVAKISAGSTKPTLLLESGLNVKGAKLQASISRSFVGSDETGETRMGTKLFAKMMHDVGDRGDLQISMTYVRTDHTVLTDARSAGQLTASYHHEIRRDWRWVAGAQRRVRRNSIDGRTGSNSVSFTFERSFSGKF
ncbi:MAG: hypothetical protein ABJN34_05710 [Litoreibacter sp.]|uniref:hypothetical protein n=1 Tax=Litoreibacter sp. TaxID=1969459 RepID=UPI003298E736